MPRKLACQDYITVVLLREVRDGVVPEAMGGEAMELLWDRAIGQSVDVIELQLLDCFAEDIPNIVLVQVGVRVLLGIGL